MAELILKVTPEEVRSKAKEIEGQRSMMEELMKEMLSKVMSLEESWHSRSGEEYISKYREMSKNISGSLDSLMNHITNLTEAAEKYEALETQQLQKTQSLSAEHIF